jgi:hypothetical protein
MFLVRFASVGERHVCVHIGQQAFGAVVLWAVARKVVEHDSVAGLGEERLVLLARRDDVVVHDEVNPARVPMRSAECRDEHREGFAGL